MGGTVMGELAERWSESPGWRRVGGVFRVGVTGLG